VDLLDVSGMGNEPEKYATRRSLRSRVSQALGLTLIMLLSLSGYLAVLKWRGPRAAVATQTPWDRAIPFWPAWVWVYLIPYVIGPPIIGLLSRDTFLWFVRRGLPLVFLSLAIFIVYPTKTVRPAVPEGEDNLTLRLYRHVVGIDEPPANAAPSLHVSLTCLLAWALLRDFPRWWPAIAGGIGLVWLATLLTWQHHLIDVGTGALLGSLFALPWPARRSQ
jgi:hypothetical protein